MLKLLAAAVLAAASISAIALAAPGAAGHAPEIVRGLELRARHKVEAAISPHAVHVRSHGSHHVSHEVSTLATRDGAGRWTVSQVVEERPGLLEINKLHVRKRALSADEAARLDRLLAVPGLYEASSPPMPNPPSVGSMFHAMEIVTPQRRTVVRWTGELRGQAGEAAGLVMGWSEPPPKWDEVVAGRELPPAKADGG